MAEDDREFRLAAYRRGADMGQATTRAKFLWELKAKHLMAVHLSGSARSEGVPSDYWDARADAFLQLIEWVERDDCGWWA